MTIENHDMDAKFTLRIPVYLRDAVDTSAASRPGRMSRNSWIAEAIVEKLKKEGVDVSAHYREDA